MIPTQKHIDAINERLIQYELSIESGELIWKNSCNVCTTIQGNSITTCNIKLLCIETPCLLYGINKFERGAPCISQNRNALSQAYYNDMPWERALKARYKEIMTHLDKVKQERGLDI